MEDTSVFQLIYVSSSVIPFGGRDLVDLLTNSRRHNLKSGITGMLLYKGGNFIQLLEGDEVAVREIYRKIVNDRRHHDIITLLQMPATQRDFSDWTMGFHNLDIIDPSEIQGYTEFLDLPLTRDSFGGNTSKCLRLLRTFKRSNA